MTSQPPPTTLSLELSKELANEGIVRALFYNAETSELILSLNHQYNEMTVTSILKLQEWNKSIQELRDKIGAKDISPSHMLMILDTLANNNDRILKYIKSRKRSTSRSGGNNSNSNDDDEKPKHKLAAFKYSNDGKGDLHEAVMLAGNPLFLVYDSKYDKIVLTEEIPEETRIIVPPHKENYPGYSPYEFSSKEEIDRLFDIAKNSTIDMLYHQAKEIASDYNDQTDSQINLLAIDMISTYFQDRFPNTHYRIMTGNNSSGKSIYGITFVATGYRPAYLMDINSANVFRILGTLENGQCTLVLDEAEKICENPDLLAILKSGYSQLGRVSRINDLSRLPEYFRVYCFKMVIAESIPKIKAAKGFRDRSFETSALRGDPIYDIKEDLQAETEGNIEGQKRLARLNSFRKVMLLYRLLHFKDPMPDIDLGFGGREKELVKPNIQLFYGGRFQKEVENTFEHFLNLKNEGKDAGLEAVLYPMVWGLVLASKTGKIYHRDVWSKVISELKGVYDSEKKPNEFQSEDFDTIYRQQVGTILEHTFGGKRSHSKTGNTYEFDPRQLKKVGRAYKLKNTIKTTLLSNEQESSVKGEQVNSVNSPGGRHRGENGEKVGKSYDNEHDPRGVSRSDGVNNDANKGYALTGSCSPCSPVHPSDKPDFDSVTKELDNLDE